jgi:hypothetical protein
LEVNLLEVDLLEVDLLEVDLLEVDLTTWRQSAEVTDNKICVHICSCGLGP